MVTYKAMTTASCNDAPCPLWHREIRVFHELDVLVNAVRHVVHREVAEVRNVHRSSDHVGNFPKLGDSHQLRTLDVTPFLQCRLWRDLVADPEKHNEVHKILETRSTLPSRPSPGPAAQRWCSLGSAAATELQVVSDARA